MGIQLKRNDVKDTISFTCTNLDGTKPNLTGATVKFKMGKTGKNSLLITNANATITDAASGLVEYTLADTDTLVAGTFHAEFEVTFQDGKVKTYPANGYIMVNIQSNVDSNQSSYYEDQIALRVSDIDVFKNDVNTKVDQAVQAVSGAQAAADSANQAATAANTAASNASTQADRAKAEADRLTGTDVSTLDNKIGSLTSLTTKTKTSVVAAINENTTSLADKAKQADLDTTNANVTSLQNNKADKSTTNDLQSQINTLVVGSGTASADDVQARSDVNGNAFPTLKAHLNNVEKSISNHVNRKYLYDWAIGRLDNGTLNSGFKSQICMNRIEYADKPITVSMSDYSLYQFNVQTFTYSGGTYTFANGGSWLAKDYVIPQGTYFKIALKKPTDTTTVLTDPRASELYTAFAANVDGSFATITKNLTEINNAKIDKKGSIFTSVKAHLDNIEKSIEDQGNRKYGYDWAVGRLDNGTLNPFFTAQICMNRVEYADKDIQISMSDYTVYQFNVQTFTFDGTNYTFKNGGSWLASDYTIKQGTYFKIALKKPSDTTTVLTDPRASDMFTAFLATSNSSNTNPDYVTKYTTSEDSLFNKVIAKQTADILPFMVLADPHAGLTNWDNVYYHGRIAAKLGEKLGVDFVLNLGDIFTDVDDVNENLNRMTKFMKYQRDTSLPLVYVKGNHETFIHNTGSGNYTALTDSQVWGTTNRFGKYMNFVRDASNSTSLYYYVDEPTRKVRMIVLDSSSNGNCGFSDAQVTWLQSVLASVPSGYKALFFTHLPPFQEALSPTTTTVLNGTNIIAAIQNFINGGGKVLAMLHGHVHWDNIYATSLGFPVISVVCAMPAKANSADFCSVGSPAVWDRSYGTFTEYAFDTFCVNVKTGEINMYRFGAGNDRTYTPA